MKHIIYEIYMYISSAMQSYRRSSQTKNDHTIKIDSGRPIPHVRYDIIINHHFVRNTCAANETLHWQNSTGNGNTTPIQK